MSTVQLLGTKGYDTQMVIHTGTCTYNVSLANEFQKHLSTAAQKHGVIYQGKYKKRPSKKNCTEREYHVKNDASVAHKDMKIFCNTNQFTSFPFCGPHTKPHDVRGLSKNRHMRFDTKLGHGICAIYHIPCACATYTSMLDKPWIPGLIPGKKTALPTCHLFLLLDSSSIL